MKNFNLIIISGILCGAVIICGLITGINDFKKARAYELWARQENQILTQREREKRNSEIESALKRACEGISVKRISCDMIFIKQPR